LGVPTISGKTPIERVDELAIRKALEEDRIRSLEPPDGQKEKMTERSKKAT
jgi:hypothetical protein